MFASSSEVEQRLTAGNDTVARRCEWRCVSGAANGVVEAFVVASRGKRVVELSVGLAGVGGGPDLDCDARVGGDGLTVVALGCDCEGRKQRKNRASFANGLTLHDARLSKLVDVLDKDGIAAVVGNIGITICECRGGEEGGSADDRGEFGEHD